MHWDNGHMDSGWGAVIMISMLLFWVLAAFAVVWFARAGAPHPSATPQPKIGPVTGDAEQILAERLARGEIEPDDYQARLTALTTPR